MEPLLYRVPRTPLVPPDGAELFPRDMTATFGAQLPLQAAQSKLAEIGQWLPIDGHPDAPLGQLIEMNSTGPLRLGYGAWRDLLLGVQFKNGQGELISAGGRTVKNVAGYDLTKFMVGQRGLFGQIVTLTTRTYRRPAAALHARFAPDPQIISRLIPSPLRPQWMILIPKELICGYLGDPRTIEFIRNALTSWPAAEIQGKSLDEDQSLRQTLWSPAAEPPICAAIPPARINHFVLEAGLSDWLADPAFGLVQSHTAADPSRLLAAARQLGGSAMILKNGKLPPDPAPNPALQSILAKLKTAFDPHNLLKPLP